MQVRRSAEAEWSGSLRAGSGAISLASGVTSELPYSLETRKAEATKSTSPEELLAAAHASCFAMSLRAVLDSQDSGAQTDASVSVEATCVLRIDASGWTIAEMVLRVGIDGLSEAEIERAVQAADAKCPISAALRGNVNIVIEKAVN